MALDDEDWDEDPNRNCCFRFKHVILMYSSMALMLGVILVLAGFLMRSSGFDELLSLQMYSYVLQQTDYRAASLCSIAVTLSVVSGFIYIIDIIPAWVGVLKPNAVFIFLLAALNAVAVILLIVTLALSVISLREASNDNVARIMNTSLLMQYGVNQTENKPVTYAWDQMQNQVQCCGVEDDGWLMYTFSKWYQQFIQPGYPAQYVPASCCSESHRNSSLPCLVNITSLAASGIHSQGCYSVLVERVRSVVAPLIGLSAAFACITLYGEMLIFIHIGMMIKATKQDKETLSNKEDYGGVNQ